MIATLEVRNASKKNILPEAICTSMERSAFTGNDVDFRVFIVFDQQVDGMLECTRF